MLVELESELLADTVAPDWILIQQSERFYKTNHLLWSCEYILLE